MIRDVHVKVTYRDNNGTTNEMTITVTGQQIAQTVNRRMSTLMPTAKVLDLTETNLDSIQLDHTSNKGALRK